MIKAFYGIVVIVALACGGCSEPSDSAKQSPINNRTTSTSSATVNRVRKIVSEQMGVEIDRLSPTTSLGDLAADELDFVELIMEIEDSFSITIPDDVAEELTGNRDWQQGMRNVTIQKLANLVEYHSQRNAE
jgi:acyl carrier protein